MILNLIIAVILENFSSLGKGNTDLVSRKDVELFSDVWADFDHDATQTIAAELLPDLLKAIPQPMGLAGAPRSWVVRVCLNLGLSSVGGSGGGGKLPFKDVLNTLVKFNYQQQMLEDLPPADSEKAKAIAARDGASPKKRAGTSMLWASKPSEAQAIVARGFALELLRLSHGTHNLRRISALPRGERIAAIRKQREANIALAAASKFSWYKVSPIAPRITRSRAPHVSCRNAP